MYSIVIADDEKIIRDGFVRMLDWEQLGFKIVACVSDGTEVIELLNGMPIDVLLTDIRMNYVSGIDLARFIHNQGIPCKVIFISGYKEFELAVQGMKYGVEDYVIKPTKKSEIEEILLKIKNQLDQQKKDQRAQEIAEMRWKAIYPVLEERFIERLLTGTMDNFDVMEQQWNMLYPEMELSNTSCALMEINIKNYQEFIREKWNDSIDVFDEMIFSTVNNFENGVIFRVVAKNSGWIKLFGLVRPELEPAIKSENESRVKLLALNSQLEETFGFEVETISIKVFDTIHQIVQAKEELFELNKNNENNNLFYFEQKRIIITNIVIGNVNTAHKILLDIVNRMTDAEMQSGKQFLVDVFSSINEFLWNNNQHLYEIVSPYILYKNILNMNSKQEIITYCDHVFESMKTKEAFEDCFDQNSLINRVKKHVRDNVCKDISLESTANEMCISLEHLSRLFKKQTGINFHQYVVRIKMEKATELLQQPQLKVYEIAIKLGYQSARNFSRQFYNYTGRFPSEYRKDVYGIGG